MQIALDTVVWRPPGSGSAMSERLKVSGNKGAGFHRLIAHQS